MDYGLIVDLETTGRDPENDKIIEIGLIEFAVDQNLHPTITGMFSALEDPQEPLKPEIKKLTHIEDEHLTGQKIDWEIVRQYFDKASIVIAHNCAFDRGFLVRRPELENYLTGIHWGCSLKHIDWEAKGFRTRALTYLAADHGFANPFAHRALFDCATTFRLVAPHLGELISNSYLKEYKVLAVGAPFDSKQKLKDRSYYWDPEQRVWFKTVLENMLKTEREFLAQEIYNGEERHQEILLDC